MEGSEDEDVQKGLLPPKKIPDLQIIAGEYPLRNKADEYIEMINAKISIIIYFFLFLNSTYSIISYI